MVKPPPFKRPSVEIHNGGPKREWMDIPAHEVRRGDMWGDHGLVENIVMVSIPKRKVYIETPYQSYTLDPDDTVHVFHVRESDNG